MDNLKLKENPTLKDYQEYVHMLEIQRGFIDQNVIIKSLLLGEEMGELFKAIRKAMNIKTDVNANINPVKEEIADILIYLCSIANRFDIDIEEAFREKEEINKKRQWI
ncbi:MAG: pyrophosphohydrolase [Bacteroidales bacterium]|nr:pyrophosphohydrolase [Bacteroidales bacterium]HRX32468.1 MazG nucleotide pyrophosphohydrolase domain-containing protein [Tenuifilaceae bacterium]